MNRAQSSHPTGHKQDRSTATIAMLNRIGSILDVFTSLVSHAIEQATQPPVTTSQKKIEPFTRTLPDLTEAELETLHQRCPSLTTHLQKCSDAFDASIACFIEQERIQSHHLEALKKTYLTCITHQFNKTPSLAHHTTYTTCVEEQLIQYLTQPRKTKITVKPTLEQTFKKTEVDSSLAYLWKACDQKTGSPSVHDFLNKISDAHGFIQVIGWATQNENSLLAILDAWNYYRYVNHIAETRFILRSLIDPFYPLFTEYQNIAHCEKNPVIKIIKAAIPMLIIAGFVISMTALIPIALPELAFFILAIPLLYLSFSIASLYVKTKEFIYAHYRQMMYHDDLALFPEFALNDKLLHTFKDQAPNIRAYYIQAIQACDAIEHAYNKQNALSRQKQQNKEDNLKHRNTLIFEWFDLRDNTKLCIDETAFIAIKRLNIDKNYLHDQIKPYTPEVKAFIHVLEQQIHEQLEESVYYDTQEDAPENPESHDIKKASLRSLSSFRFFPDYIKQHTKIIQLETLEDEIITHLQNINA